MAAKTTKRLILGVNAKGGVGKTRWGIGYVDYRRIHGLKVAAWDADGQVGGLLLTMGTRDDTRSIVQKQNPAEGVGDYDIRSETERLQLVNSLTSDSPVVYHDLAGGSVEEIARINTEDLHSEEDVKEGISKFLNSVERRGFRCTLVHVLSPNVAATGSVARYLDLFEDRADHVVVLNRFWGREFPYWSGFIDGQGRKKGGATRPRFLEFGGVEIEMPAMPAVTAAKIEAEAVRPSMAAEDAQFTPAEQDHCFNFNLENAKQLQRAAKFLGL